MYKQVTGNVSFPEQERRLLQEWEDNQIFTKSLGRSTREMVFYDGPPFPTGAPHYGTIFVSIIKDAMARFFTMKGWSVPRRWGWDCHGLPIENAVEKQLGITDKTEIEANYGVAEFNEACRSLVAGCNEAWEIYIRKIGRWVDYEHAYRTMDVEYMESVLWVFQQAYKKGLIYRDYRVTPYCYRCETALSISDTRESDSTRPRQDPEIVVAFEACDLIAGKPAFYLAWTTTPWTLPANLALAVGADFQYAAFEFDGQVFVMAEQLLGHWTDVFGKQPKIIAHFSGADLAGKRYKPLFPYFQADAVGGAFRILAADFVTLTDGVGIVHCAPAFGEDDYWLCKRHEITTRNPVDSKGCFTEEVPEFAGRNVHECNRDIIRLLKERRQLLLHRTLEHNYPHCWRCRMPLIYRAMDAWYFAVEKIKADLLRENEKINWVPEHVKHGRFGKWLEGARDWNISRSRYWGTPIPVWVCENKKCHKWLVVGSRAEIEAITGKEVKDLHKEHLDLVFPICEDCGSQMKRVPEVLDCWFESGSMPYGQCHYPFENREWFEEHFPADFIIEYPGQIRGWFYYLHVLGVALMGRAAFKNCLVHGTLLASDGAKISKSRQNFTDPMELIDRHGADALRLYLLNSPAVAMDDMNFKDAGVPEQARRVLLPLWNAYSFFSTYANIDNFKGDPSLKPSSENPLDLWILSLLEKTSKQTSKAYERFYLNQALAPLVDFLDDLTNWYIRRSRERFWGGGMTQDKRSAYETLYYVLINTTKMLAPAAPFISDLVYRYLTEAESVHLADWPDIPQAYSNAELIEETAVARLIVSLGLALRQKLGIKVRQPLALLSVVLPERLSKLLTPAQQTVIASELNIKAVKILQDYTGLAELRIIPDARAIGPVWGTDTQHIIRAAKAGQVREKDGKIEVFEGERTWTLESDQAAVSYIGRDGAEVMADRDVVVALDHHITPRLQEEGIANELNRLIQDLRKQAEYAVSDRIRLMITGSIADDWLSHLADLALAELTDIPPGTADAEAEDQIAGRQFHVAVYRPETNLT